jgi:ribosome-associated translation inhibitor RaiA
MALQTTLNTNGMYLSEDDQQRIQHQLDMLERRLVHRPDPSAVLVFTDHPSQRTVQVELRVQLGPLGAHLISHQSAETAPHAVRLAVQDVERQLERQQASQRGEPSFGVISRREPRHRPASRKAGTPPAEEPE